jgi:hypothetical protein
LLANGKKVSYIMRLGSWELKDCGLAGEVRGLKKPEKRSKTHAGRSRSGLQREPECVGKQKRYQYMIALLRFYSVQDRRGGGLMSDWDLRLRPQTDGISN